MPKYEVELKFVRREHAVTEVVAADKEAAKQIALDRGNCIELLGADGDVEVVEIKLADEEDEDTHAKI